MLAVIKTGGKQYLVEPGKKLKVEKLKEEEGKEITFDQVLLIGEGDEIKIGTPFIEGAKVKAKILSHGKDDKVIVFKYKPKKRYQIKKGHRQPYTEVEIIKVEG